MNTLVHLPRPTLGARLLAAIRMRRARRAAEHDLRLMSAAALADIGLDRSMIPVIAAALARRGGAGATRVTILPVAPEPPAMAARSEAA